MKELVNFIRSSAGRNSVPTNYNQHMYEKSNMMENIYKEGLYEFQTDKEGIKNIPVVYANATELLDFVFENNDEDDDMYVIQKCVPPELHLLQGFVNHLFWDGARGVS